MQEYERWLVIPDLQIPYQDVRTLKAIEQYVKDVQASSDPFVGFIQMGDFLDFNELSRWNTGYEASIIGDVKASFDAGNEFLDRWRKLLGEDCKMVLLQGN